MGDSSELSSASHPLPTAEASRHYRGALFLQPAQAKLLAPPALNAVLWPQCRHLGLAEPLQNSCPPGDPCPVPMPPISVLCTAAGTHLLLAWLLEVQDAQEHGLFSYDKGLHFFSFSQGSEQQGPRNTCRADP